MKSKAKKIIGLIVFLVLLLGTLLFRHQIADLSSEVKKANLPPPTPYQEVKETQAQDTEIAPSAPVEGGLAESEHFKLESSPQTNQKQVDVLKRKI